MSKRGSTPRIQLGQLTAGEKMIGYVGRGAGVKVGAHQFCIVGASDFALAYISKEWLHIEPDYSEYRDSVFIRRSHYDALVAATSKALRVVEKLPATEDGILAVLDLRNAIKAVMGEA